MSLMMTWLAVQFRAAADLSAGRIQTEALGWAATAIGVGSVWDHKPRRDLAFAAQCANFALGSEVTYMTGEVYSFLASNPIYCPFGLRSRFSQANIDEFPSNHFISFIEIGPSDEERADRFLIVNAATASAIRAPTESTCRLLQSRLGSLGRSGIVLVVTNS